VSPLKGKNVTKRFPYDYDRDKLIEMVRYHSKEHREKAIELDRTKQRLIGVSKELSALKRKKP
jgi:hypothetical protein